MDSTNGNIKILIYLLLLCFLIFKQKFSLFLLIYNFSYKDALCDKKNSLLQKNCKKL